MHEGEIYESTHSGDRFKIVDAPEFGASEDAQVECRRISDNEWYSFYKDNFRSDFKKIADSEDELD